MNVLLVFPNVFLGKSLRLNIPIHPPLGIAYLGAVLEKAGHEVTVEDCSAENRSLKSLLKRIHELSPDVIGISANISTAHEALMTARYLKDNGVDAPIVFGGPWPTVEYKFLLEKGFADVVVIGEGEQTILELLERLPAARLVQPHPDLSPLRGVAGIAFRDASRGNDGSSEVVMTGPRPFIEDLDSLPFPAWHLFPKRSKYNFVHRRSPFFPVMTTRGCPFDCIHCTKLVHGYKYRKRSIDNVISEIRYLKDRFDVKEIFIIDDSFNLDISRASRILLRVAKEFPGILIKFTNGLRADRITSLFARVMRRAGVYAASLGIESGNQEIVNKIGKKLDLGAVRHATRILKRNGIIVGGFFILGHPHDTVETMNETITFAKELDLDYPQFFKSLPFPGTKMHEIIAREGEFIKDREYQASSGYIVNKVNFRIWGVDPGKIERAFKLSYRSFYLRPLKVIRLVSQYRSINEIWWLVTSFIKVILQNLSFMS